MLLLAASEMAPAQESSSVAEKNAADAVARLVQQTRQQGKLPDLSRIEDPRLREGACARAEEDATLPNGLWSICPGCSGAFLFFVFDP